MAEAQSLKSRIVWTFGLLIGLNLVFWAIALITFRAFPLLIGTATLAYTFGLRHALDADHLSAIDNVTRKLVQEGQRPVGVGFFFSLGHSTIVVLLSVLIALTAGLIQQHFPTLQTIGALVGTSVSALFLLAIAAINLFVLREVARSFARMKRGEAYEEQMPDTSLRQLGIMGRVFRPVLRIVDRSWKMYIVGLLFGLGFDTATEIGLLGISATAATRALSIWSILLFPALFTAGMCLVDTADGVLMLGAYGWAYVHPVRKLYYNLTITSVSVLVALIVGGIEVLGVLRDQFDLHGGFWDPINRLGDHFGELGVLIVCIFLFSWLISTLAYRVMGYSALERRPMVIPADIRFFERDDPQEESRTA